MSSDQASLAALQRTLSNGSKLIVAGAVSAISGALLDVLLQSGHDPGQITPIGLNIPLPAPFAVLVLMAISGAAGWAGWAYLRQAQRLMHHLEFDNDVNPDEIKTALSGSSLASTSILLLKLLCVIAIFAFSKVLVGVSYFFYLLNLQNIESLNLIFRVADSLFILPFFLVLLSPKLRYFQPSSWESKPWLLRLIMKDFINPPSFSEYYMNYEIPGSQVSKQDAVEEVFVDLLKYIPQAYEISFNTLLRKYGFKIVILWKNIDAFILGEIRPLLEKKAGELLYRKFPDLDPEQHIELKEYLVKIFTSK